MERTTAAKNYWMMARSALDTVRQYVVFRDDLSGRHRALMDARVTSFAASIYCGVALSTQRYKRIVDLEQYDVELKSISAYFYDRVGAFVSRRRWIGCKCTEAWRAHSCLGRLRLFFFAWWIRLTTVVGWLKQRFRRR